MEQREYENMARIEDRHFWFVQTRAMVRDALVREGIKQGDLLLDVGCGTGGTISKIKDLCRPVGVDMSPMALRFTKEKTGALVMVADATALPLRTESFDFAIALDVIEHIPDDVAALRQIHRVLKPNGKLVITVPAHQYLFSTHDRALHHVRRYSRKGLADSISKAGFRILDLTYTNFSLFPAIATVRLAKKALSRNKTMPSSDAKVPAQPINSALSWIMGQERKWLQKHHLPYGVGLMAVVQKSP